MTCMNEDGREMTHLTGKSSRAHVDDWQTTGSYWVARLARLLESVFFLGTKLTREHSLHDR